MFGRNGRTEAVKESAAETAQVAVGLVQDRRFRDEVLDAVRHAAVARDKASRRVGVLAMAARLAADDDVRRELVALGRNFRVARDRVERVRDGERSHKVRNTVVLLLAAGGAVAAMPQTRTWLTDRLPRLGAGRRARVITDSIEVNVPVSTAYNQWTQFEEFPEFMQGVDEVQQLDDTTLRWVASIAGKQAEWQATILEQHPDRQVTWVTGEGKRTRGTVTFEPLGPDRTRLELTMSYVAEGARELAGSVAGLDARRVRGDLERFKEFIESRGTESGAWRGEVSGGATTQANT